MNYTAWVIVLVVAGLLLVLSLIISLVWLILQQNRVLDNQKLMIKALGHSAGMYDEITRRLRESGPPPSRHSRQ